MILKLVYLKVRKSLTHERLWNLYLKRPYSNPTVWEQRSFMSVSSAVNIVKFTPHFIDFVLVIVPHPKLVLLFNDLKGHVDVPLSF